MGNIKTHDIKKAAVILMDNYPEKFTPVFADNKAVIKEMNIADSKLMLNKVAGSVTRLHKIRARESA